MSGYKNSISDIDGNVGIGTTSPGYTLDVNGSLHSTNLNIADGIYHEGDTNTYIQFVSNDTIRWVTSGVERMRLNSVGGLGINTSIITSNRTLDVNGNALVRGRIYIGPEGGSGSDYSLEIGQGRSGNGYAYIDLSGDATYGVDYSLRIFRDNTGANAQSKIIHRGTGNFSIDTTDNANIILNSGTSNVGIGTTSPTYKLDVNGNIKGTGFSQLDHLNCISTLSFGAFVTGVQGTIFEGYSTNSVVRTDSARLDFYMGKTTTGVGTMMSLTDTGNVGIGTTEPVEHLSVEGSGAQAISIYSTDTGVQSTPKTFIKLYGENTAAQKKLQAQIASAPGHNASNAGELQFFTADSSSVIQQRMTIREDGNVGIGTTSPGYTLDVTGTIRATGDVIAFSDERVKENIHTIENALDKVNKLRGVEYNKIGEEKQSIGVIAQEIEKILPQVVHEDEEGMKSVAYGNIVGVLIEAIKEQQKQIDELKMKIDGITN